jgi:hypothetical protein
MDNDHEMDMKVLVNFSQLVPLFAKIKMKKRALGQFKHQKREEEEKERCSVEFNLSL